MVRYRNGDMAAFETLYAHHKAPLYRYFLRQGQSREHASELYQEVWIKIIRARIVTSPRRNSPLICIHWRTIV